MTIESDAMNRALATVVGNHTGYYYTESLPTYLIEIAPTRAQDSWQIVFLRDRDRKVSEFVIYKN